MNRKPERKEDNYRVLNTKSREDQYRLKPEPEYYEEHITPKPLKPKQEEVYVKKTYSYEVK